MLVVLSLSGVTAENEDAVVATIHAFNGKLTGIPPNLNAVFEVADEAAAAELLSGLQAALGDLGVTVSRIINDRDVTIMSSREEYRPKSLPSSKLGM